MNLISAHIPASWSWLLWPLAGLLFYGMGRRAHWRMLADRDNLNVFAGACVAVLLLWLIKAGVKPGLNFHLLGASALTLMFRPWFALLALAVVLAAVTLLSGEYAAYPANLLLMAVLPVTLSWGIYLLGERWLPHHLFIYVFLNGFFGSALAVSAVGLASTGFVAMAGAYPLDYLLDNYLPFYLLMAWSEAFATGMIITILVVYKPEWLATFDDRRYLHGK
jgi:uncharacterized membrane protein